MANWLSGFQLAHGKRRTGLRPRANYAGAQVSRLTWDWIFSALSADQEILASDLLTLRARARELVRNTSWGRRYAELLANNVVGQKGIGFQARLIKGDGLPAEDLNAKIEEAFARWGLRYCTVDRKLTWRGVQRLAMKSMPGDGEFFIRLIRGFDNPFRFALQLLDPDQLDHTFNRLAEPGKNEIRMGVEIDTWGAPVFYHLWAGHPSEIGGRRDRLKVPAEQIIHLYDPERVAQTRGVPWLTPVMLDVNMLRGYYEAELVAARASAAKMGWIVRKGEDAAATYAPSTEHVDSEEGESRPRIDAEPGVIEELPPGAEFQGWDPDHPTTAFDGFTKSILRSIAAGLNASYATLSGDLTDVNFSSIRQGVLDERDTHRARAWNLIDSLHRRVYAEWVRMALLSGQLDTRVDMSRYFEIEWQPRGWPWVDPEKDVDAVIKGIETGLNSRTHALAEQGRDYEEVLSDLQREKALAAAAGVDVEERQAPQPAQNGNGRNGNRMAALLEGR